VPQQVANLILSFYFYLFFLFQLVCKDRESSEMVQAVKEMGTG